MTDPVTPAVSVIVPTRNRPEFLADTLASLLRQDYPRERYEIVVVDDGSSPPVQVPQGVRLVRHERSRGLNAARNTGATEARYELLSYVDDDIDAPTDWLSEFARGAGRHPEAWCLGGPIRLRIEGAALRSCPYCRTAREWETELDLGNVEGVTGAYVYGANIGARKRALLDAGPFDEDRPIYFEEVEWQDRVRKAGGDVVYLPSAWLWHRRTRESLRLRGRLARSFRQGRGSAFYRRSQGLPLERRPGGIARSLAHAVRHRCRVGLLNAAVETGRLVGAAQFAVANRRLESHP